MAAFTAALVIAPAHAITIDTIPVATPGNTADETGFGAVGYEFELGTYEVTMNQYAAFLNSVATIDTSIVIVGLWNAQMVFDDNVAGIRRSGAGFAEDPFSYAVFGDGDRPVTYVSWFDAARFANWVNNGATSSASTETGAYALNGTSSGYVARNPGATWWIPSVDEWYKAAYFKGGSTSAGYWRYPTRSDDPPGNVVGGGDNRANVQVLDAEFQPVYSVTQSADYFANVNYLTAAGAFGGSPSAFGTFDQAGNVFEWNEAFVAGQRGYRGGSWNSGDAAADSSWEQFAAPDAETAFIGFRVATVPEPSAAVLLAMGVTAALMWSRTSRVGLG